MDLDPSFDTSGSLSAARMEEEDYQCGVEESMGSSSSKGRPSEVTWADMMGDDVPEYLDTAANSVGPKGLSRAAYARKVFVATKTGYLMKKSGTELGENSGGGGLGKIKFMNYVAKKRFFVLTGTSVMYHHDHNNLDDNASSKEILLDGDSKVSSCEMPSPLFGIELIADGKATQIGAKDEQERQEWLVAISTVIRKLHGKKRGYLLKLRAGVPTPSPLPLPKAPLAAAVERGDFKHASDGLLEGKGGVGEWTPKYFMLDEGKLTFHASHSSTLVVQGSFKLPRTTQVEARQGLLLVVRNGANELVCRAAEERDLSSWENAINEAVQENARRRSKIMEEKAARGEDPLAVGEDLDGFVEDRTSPLTDSWTGARGISVEESSVIRSKGFDATQGGSFSGLEGVGGGGALLKGDLMTRPFSGDGPWRAAHYVLEKGRLLLFEDRHHVRPKQVHKISPSCAVFETNLKAFSFELVVSGRVLHLQGSSFEDSLRWIATLKAAINNSPPDETDPLLVEALKLEDTFYYADFETKQSLGVVLERSKEWAIVKLANPQLSQVSVGSALASVNGESVVLRAYDDTIAMLTGWKPPLNLIFRRAPVKEGMLKRATKGEKHKGATKWKQTWVDLREGKLSWFKLSPGGIPVGVMPMIGSAVAMLSPNQTGVAHCFSVAGGVTSVIFQASSHQEMVSWAAHIYQASAVANGGGYLLDQERDQEIAYEEERRRRFEWDDKW